MGDHPGFEKSRREITTKLIFVRKLLKKKEKFLGCLENKIEVILSPEIQKEEKGESLTFLFTEKEKY